MTLPATLALLREADLRRLLIGQAASWLGDQMTPLALTFAILDRGGSATAVGVVLAAGTAAMVVFLLLGGVIADRWPRRRVMLGADLLRLVVQGVTAGLLATGRWQVWELAALQAAWGVGAAFFFPALTGLLPEMVPPEQLRAANALQGVAASLGALAGPGLAGALVATIGAAPAVAVDAATFAFSALFLARVAAPVLRRRGASSALGELRAGWQEFRSRTWLWVVVLQYSLWHLLGYAPVLVLGAVVARQQLGGAAAWGAILAAFGAGSLLGSVLALRLRVRRPLLVSELLTAAFAAVPALLALGAPPAVIAVAAVVSGAGFSIFGVLWQTALQTQVPAAALSRVSSYDWLGSLALLPAGYALAGPAAARLGLHLALALSAAWILLSSLAVLMVPSVRRLAAEPPVSGAGQESGSAAANIAASSKRS